MGCPILTSEYYVDLARSGFHFSPQSFTELTDPRTGESVTHYNSLGQVDYVEDAAGKQTSFTYESTTGRKASVVNALNKATSYTYNSRGQIRMALS